LAQLPHLPQQLTSTQVIIRFCLRMTILVIFAAFASIGFGRSLAALLRVERRLAPHGAYDSAEDGGHP
jgi:hypothetical protein